MKYSNNNEEKYFFEIHKDYNNLFYFDLKDEEGNFLLESSLYKRKTNYLKGVKNMIRSSKNKECVFLGKPFYEKWAFLLRARNNRVLAISDCFDTEEEAKNLIEYLKKISVEIPVVDKIEN